MFATGKFLYPMFAHYKKQGSECFRKFFGQAFLFKWAVLLKFPWWHCVGLAACDEQFKDQVLLPHCIKFSVPNSHFDSTMLNCHLLLVHLLGPELLHHTILTERDTCTLTEELRVYTCNHSEYLVIVTKISLCSQN